MRLRQFGAYVRKVFHLHRLAGRIMDSRCNPTIVVFDRVRENLLKTQGSFEEIVERSVNETLARSINTSLAVFFPLLAIFLWGGETLKWFALTLIIGLIAGTYSSIFLCAPLLVVFQKKSRRKGGGTSPKLRNAGRKPRIFGSASLY